MLLGKVIYICHLLVTPRTRKAYPNPASWYAVYLCLVLKKKKKINWQIYGNSKKSSGSQKLGRKGVRDTRGKG